MRSPLRTEFSDLSKRTPWAQGLAWELKKEKVRRRQGLFSGRLPAGWWLSAWLSPCKMNQTFPAVRPARAGSIQLLPVSRCWGGTWPDPELLPRAGGWLLQQQLPMGHQEPWALLAGSPSSSWSSKGRGAPGRLWSGSASRIRTVRSAASLQVFAVEMLLSAGNYSESRSCFFSCLCAGCDQKPQLCGALGRTESRLLEQKYTGKNISGLQEAR